MMQKVFQFVSKSPKRIIVGSVIISAIFIVALMGTSIQTNIHQFIDQKYIGALDDINEIFNERDLLSLTIEVGEGKSVLDLDMLKEQDRFFQEVQEKWPVEVDSITNMLNRHFGYEINGKSFSLQDIPDSGQNDINKFLIALYLENPYEFERIARKALSDEEIVDKLQELNIVKYAVGGILPTNVEINFPKVSAMRATIKTTESVDRETRREIFSGIRELAESYSDDINIRLYSYELIEKDIDGRVLGKSPYVTGFMLLLLAAVLYATFRSIYFTIVPILVLCLAIFWAFGTAAILGVKDVSFVHLITIPLLLGQCIDNLLHFNERFREEYATHSKKEAVKIVFVTAGKAAILTTLLNMVAFTADIFTTNLIPVKEYALVIVLGLGIALLVTYIVGTAIILMSKLKVDKTSIQNAQDGSDVARKLFDFLNKNKLAVLVVAFAMLGSMLFSITKIDTAFRSTSYMSDSFETYDAFQFEKDNFAVYLPHYVLIKGNIATQEALDAVTDIENTLDGIEDVEHIHNSANTESINYLLAKFDKSAFPDSLKELYSKIINSDTLINPVALLTARDIAPKILQEKDGEFPATLVKFWPAETDSFAIKRIADSITNATKEYSNELEITPTGVFLAFSRTMDDILWSATYATFITFFIIVIFLWFTFKRIKTSLLAAIPVIFGASFGLGMLPILNIELNALNGTIAVLAMGLGIDYAIQIMNRYHEELTKSETPEKAMRETFGFMLIPLGQCVILTTAGLFVLIGLLPITGKFGIAAAVSLITGYLGAVIILPIFAIKAVKTCPKSVAEKYKVENM